jgi:ABC-type branched-subunit amino acid transport system ATPase component
MVLLYSRLLEARRAVRKGLALSPEGWRLFVQQSVENNLLLGATPLAVKARKALLLERLNCAQPLTPHPPEP